jgi:hypothetical protein
VDQKPGIVPQRWFGVEHLHGAAQEATTGIGVASHDLADTRDEVGEHLLLRVRGVREPGDSAGCVTQARQVVQAELGECQLGERPDPRAARSQVHGLVEQVDRRWHRTGVLLEPAEGVENIAADV